MALVISDVHGNYAKVKAFIDYKPAEEHVIIGDFMDSYSASDDDLIATMKLAVESNCVLLAGNHELPYLSNAHSYFKCSGNRHTPALFHVVNAYKDLLHGAILRDNFLITHGGLSAHHGRVFDDVEQACVNIHDEFEWYKRQPVAPESLSWIFDIGTIRGGFNEAGGVFWCSIGYEKMEHRFNQVVGHTPKEAPVIMKHKGGKMHVGIDSPKFMCFNTSTKQLEDFMPEEYKYDDQMRSMLERKF